MIKESLISFFKKNTEIFERTYSVASKTADVDAVHDMRVSLKRINTCIRMLNYEKQANYRLKKCFKPLTKLFKKAGPVRDFQVQAIIIQDFRQNINIDESLINLFIEKKNSLVKDFIDICKAINSLKVKRTFRVVEHYISTMTENKISKQIENYEKNRKSILKKYSNPQNKLFNLHNARKIIKDLGYLIEMSGTTQTSKEGDYTTFKLTGRLLGDWHDRAVMLNFLNHIKVPEEEKTSDNVESLIFSVSGQKEMFQERYLEEYRTWSKE